MKWPGLPFWLAVSLAAHAVVVALFLWWPGALAPIPAQPVTTTIGFVELPVVSAVAAAGNASRDAASASSKLAVPPRVQKVQPAPRPVLPPKPKQKTKPARPAPAKPPRRRHPAQKPKNTVPAKIRESAAPAPLPPVPPPAVPQTPQPAPATPALAAPAAPADASATTELVRKGAVAQQSGQALGTSARQTRAGAPLQGARVGATPSYAVNPPPVYPALARRNGWEGEVLLRVRVTAQGRVAEVKVDRSSGHAVLDRSAVAAVRNWEFNPARVGTTPVAGEVRVPIRFELHGSMR